MNNNWDGISLREEDGKGVLELRGELTVVRAGAMAEAFTSGLDNFAELRVEFKDVESVDLALFQVIVAAAKTARARNIRLYCPDLPETVRQGAARAGLERAVEKDGALGDVLPLIENRD